MLFSLQVVPRQKEKCMEKDKEIVHPPNYFLLLNLLNFSDYLAQTVVADDSYNASQFCHCHFKNKTNIQAG